MKVSLPLLWVVLLLQAFTTGLTPIRVSAALPPINPLVSTPAPLPGPDRDGDGLSDLQELRIGTDPTKPDTDGDGFNDGMEYQLRTDPKNSAKTPLFLLSTNQHQHLSGELLIIRPTMLTNFIVITNIEITNIPPVYEGTPLDTDGDGQLDACDADGDGAPDAFEVCTITTPGSTKTNITVITNYVQFQWFAGTNALATQTNANLVLLNVSPADAGVYHLEAKLLVSDQTSDDVPVEIFAEQGRVRPPSRGRAVGWGDNSASQTKIPQAATVSVVQVGAGFLDSVALLGDGSVVAWGDGQLGQTNVPVEATNVVAIAAGAAHVLALRGDGTVVGWGENQYGQATPPEGLTDVIAISAGYFHSVALKADGTVVCWGDNAFGQLDLPAQLGPVKKISAGLFHTLALTAGGGVVGWGDNSQKQCDTSTVLDLLTDVVEIAAGGSHSLALRRDGIVVAWGATKVDESGEIAIGAQAVVPELLPKATAIVAGFDFSGVITHDNQVVIWGGTAAVRTTQRLTRPIQLAGGYFHILALDTATDVDGDGLDSNVETPLELSPTLADTDKDGLWDGVEVKLGFNPRGADTDGDGLLDGDEYRHGFDPLVATEAPSGSLKALPAWDFEFFASGRTVFVFQGSPGDGTWQDLAGPFTPRRGVTRVLTNAPAGLSQFRLLPVGTASGGTLPEAGPPEPVLLGTVAAWGNNEFGQINVPVTLDRVTALAAGIWHTLALREDGSVVAWGLNEAGQTDVPASLNNVAALAGGGQHSLALRTTGEIVGWGSNAYGQLNVPQLDLPATAIAAGGSHSLALLADGTVLAWGANESGQAAVPADLTDVTAIAAGRFHSVALRADGSVVSWGDSGLGQSSTPVGLAPVKAIAAGFGHTAVVTRDGHVVCWGNNTVGQCNVPEGLSGIAAVWAGNRWTIARTEAGQYVGWGQGGETLAANLNTFGATGLVAAGSEHIVATNLAADADQDGVDDRYELNRGMNPASNDSDGDGLDDQTELLAGFNPTNASESAEGAVKTFPGLQLRFFTLGGETWRLERSTDLVTWRAEGALEPDPQFLDRNGYTDVFVGIRNRDFQVWRLLRVSP